MRQTIRFLLGDEPREFGGFDPTLTVLDWLRLQEGRTGTKEGCAEGDCGACTIVVGRLVAGAMRYEAVNACIRLMATLDGCQLLTVEHLKRPDGRLHPVQQALVEAHGSQCGFCTPGIVMSLYALWLQQDDPHPARVETVLQGNLCRCTGYEPIVKAAQNMGRIEPEARADAARAAAHAAQLIAVMADEETIAFEHGERAFFAPADLDRLAAILEDRPETTIVAGATDIGLWVTKKLKILQEVVWLGRIPELRAIGEMQRHIEIGAMLSYSDVWGHLARLFPDLGELIRRIGGEQVRNQGTIGGNIANGSPIGDMPPALIALDASLTLRCGAETRSLPLEDFFIAYGEQDLRAGEFLVSVKIPKLAPQARFRAYKASKRFEQDISAVCAAFHVTPASDRTIARARIAFGGMAGTPKRALAAEEALIGRSWTRTSFMDAAQALAHDFTPLSDMRASADYRMHVARNLFERFFIETSGQRVETRLAGDPRLAYV